MTNTLQTTTCPKCDGKKVINPFRHYAGGICFFCGGSGLVQISRKQAKNNADAAAETLAKRNWLLNANYEQMSALPWKKLHAAMSFASACAACGDTQIAAVLPIVKKAFEAAYSRLYWQK